MGSSVEKVKNYEKSKPLVFPAGWRGEISPLCELASEQAVLTVAEARGRPGAAPSDPRSTRQKRKFGAFLKRTESTLLPGGTHRIYAFTGWNEGLMTGRH